MTNRGRQGIARGWKGMAGDGMGEGHFSERVSPQGACPPGTTKYDVEKVERLFLRTKCRDVLRTEYIVENKKSKIRK